MNITMCKITDIRPDPNQPRKVFDDDHIEGLAKSLGTEGMINPIEVNEQMMIITGECRWRAASLLGWAEVPININSSKYSDYEKLRHQMAENVHQSGTKESVAMNAIDVAKAYAQLFKLKSGRDWGATPPSHKESYGILKEIADEIGITTDTVHDYLKLLEEPEFVQKDIQAGRSKSYYVEAQLAEESQRESLKKQIASGSFENAKQVRDVATISKKLPELAKMRREQTKNTTETNRILNNIAKLALSLKAKPLTLVDPTEVNIVKAQLHWLENKISEYLVGDHI